MSRSYYLAKNLLLGMVLSSYMASTFAETLNPDTATAIKLVVQSHLSAFAKGDAIRAFAMTTPAVRKELGTPENLLLLVEQEYDPLCHHRGLIYMAAEAINGDVTQAVRVTDLEDHVWLVVYEMKQQSDGNWRIDGWQLLETNTIST